MPRADRELNHVSRPLRHQMKHLIDRGRWPVLVTYSDEGQGHTGHVYKCSGWEKGPKARRPVKETKEGIRASSYSNGKHGGRDLVSKGFTTVQRWEHHVKGLTYADDWLEEAGWVREPIPGKFWKNGSQAHRIVCSLT